MPRAANGSDAPNIGGIQKDFKAKPVPEVDFRNRDSLRLRVPKILSALGGWTMESVWNLSNGAVASTVVKNAEGRIIPASEISELLKAENTIRKLKSKDLVLDKEVDEILLSIAALSDLSEYADLSKLHLVMTSVIARFETFATFIGALEKVVMNEKVHNPELIMVEREEFADYVKIMGSRCIEFAKSFVNRVAKHEIGVLSFKKEFDNFNMVPKTFKMNFFGEKPKPEWQTAERFDQIMQSKSSIFYVNKVDVEETRKFLKSETWLFLDVFTQAVLTEGDVRILRATSEEKQEVQVGSIPVPILIPREAHKLSVSSSSTVSRCNLFDSFDKQMGGARRINNLIQQILLLLLTGRTGGTADEIKGLLSLVPEVVNPEGMDIFKVENYRETVDANPVIVSIILGHKNEVLDDTVQVRKYLAGNVVMNALSGASAEQTEKVALKIINLLGATLVAPANPRTQTRKFENIIKAAQDLRSICEYPKVESGDTLKIRKLTKKLKETSSGGKPDEKKKKKKDNSYYLFSGPRRLLIGNVSIKTQQAVGQVTNEELQNVIARYALFTMHNDDAESSSFSEDGDEDGED